VVSLQAEEEVTKLKESHEQVCVKCHPYRTMEIKAIENK